MARTDNFSEVHPHCVMCGELIPPDRPKQAITCSDKCSADRKNWRRGKQDARECRYCKRPASQAERSRYLRWRRWEEKNPPPESELSPWEIADREYRKANPPKKRGPKPKRTDTIQGDEDGYPGTTSLEGDEEYPVEGMAGVPAKNGDAG